jgi:PAS domain S-box-containing protein
MTFGRKILIFSFLLLPVLLITVYSFFQTRRQLMDKVYEDRRALTSLSAAMLNAKLDHLKDIGISLSTQPVFRNYFNDQKWVEAIELMEEVPQHFEFIKQVAIADTNGNILASHPKIDSTINLNRSGTNWYKGVSNNWDPYLSEIHKIKEERHIVTTLAVPVKTNEGHVSGILVLEVSVPDMLAWSNSVSVGKSGFVYIVDQKGHIAVNPDYPEADSIIDYSSVPAVQKALQGQFNTEVLYNPIAKEERLSSYQQLPHYKWAVIVQQQATTALLVNNSLRTVLLFYVFIILLAIIFAWLIIKEITRRKKTEEQLSTYANMVDNTHVLIRGIDDRIKFWNKGMEELYGWTKEEVVGKNAHQLFNTQFVQPLFEIKERLLSYNQWVGELKHTRKDGRVIHVFSHWYLHRDENGNPVAVIETNNDITALKQTEEKLKKSEESIRLLIDNVKDYAIFMLDNDGRIVTWNNGATHIKGYTEQEAVGRSIDIFYSKKEVEEGEPQYNLEMAKEFGYFETEGWRVRKDGTKFWANIVFTALKDEAGILYGFSKVTRDITERRKAQEEKDFLSRLINRSNDSIYTLDAGRKVKTWNKGAENLYGYTKEEMIGKDPNSILQTVITEEQTNKILEEIADKHYWTGEVMRKHKAGEDIWVKSSSTTILDNEGNITGYVSVGFDITEQKKLRDEVNHLASIVEQSTEAITSIGLDQRIITWNSGAEKLHGYTKEEAIGQTSASINITHLNQNEIKQLLQEVMEKGVWKKEMPLFHKNGSSFFGDVTANLIKNNKGSITSFNFIVKDISERKKLQEQLQEFEHFFVNSNDFSAIANKEGYFEVVNPSFVNVLGYSQKELSENPFLNYVHPDDVPATLEVYDELKAGALVIHFINRYRKSDGTYLWFDWNATPNPVTGKLYCIARDITDRKKAEHELTKLNEELEIKIAERTEAINRSEKQYRYLFENNPMPMWIIDLQSFKFLDVNEMAILRYGYSRQDFLSMTAVDIRPESERESFTKADHSFKTNATNYNKGIWNHRKKDGTIIQVEVIAHSILFKGVQARLILSNDVTEQKKAEEKLISSEERFRTLIENNYDIITLMDASFNVIYRSPSTYRITGWTNEEMISKGGTKNIHPADTAYFHGIINKIMAHPATPVKVSFRSRHKKGHYLWLEGTLTNLLHQENINAIVFNAKDVTERIEGEENLAASELKFRSLIENSSEGITLSDASSNITYRSPSSAKIAGGLYQDNIFSCIHPQDKAPIEGIINAVVSQPGVPIPFQARFMHAKGHYYWLEGMLTNMLHVKGINAIVSNYHDITQRKELEDLLHKANKLARIGGWEIDLVKETIYWSDITRDIHETDENFIPDLATGLNFYKGEAAKELMAKKVKEAIELGTPWDVELQIITAKNNEPWIRSIGEAEFVNGKCVRVYGSFQDIDQRKRAEEKLKASEEQFRNSMDNMMEGVQIVGFDWKYLYVNDALCRQGKYSKNELIGHTMMEKYPGIEHTALFKSCQQCFTERVSIHMENEFLFPDGSKQWFELSLQPVPEGIFILSMDTTERKNAENKILNLNAELEYKVNQRTEQLKKTNEELEAFSYSVSHDLRAPLRAIIGFANILEEDYAKQLDDEAKRITGIIKNNTSKMGNLIDDLLTFSRMGRHDLLKIKIDTNQMVQEVKEILDKQNNNTKKVKWHIQHLPEINADISTIRQVWVNLLSNAFKYSGSNPHPQIEIGSVKQTGQIIFYVQDNGVGFDEKYKSKLFKVFQRLHSADEFEGTGIGLAIVDKIVSKHGGKVWAEGEINKGAKFYFSLPVN